jgi:hypothetical protein
MFYLIKRMLLMVYKLPLDKIEQLFYII